MSVGARFAKSQKVTGSIPDEVIGNILWHNLLAPEIFFLILAHSVYKIWIIQKPNKLELWNKLHFKEKKNGECTACLKSSVPIFVQ